MEHYDADFKDIVAREVTEELRHKIAKAGMGVTLIGNRLTIRWGRKLKQVHMVILDVEDGEEPEYDDADLNK
jgi:hypothetical protein